MKMYKPEVVEKEILKFWQENKIYEKLKEKTKNGEKFYFLDGPPYTSGAIHVGHAWNKALKDMLIRYKRMQGFSVFDRAGFDMHGLPTENKVMQKLGLKFKEDILKFGLKQFILECKNFSLEMMNKMIQDFKRLGVWMDFEKPYMSITPEFIESVWWLIKQAEKNGRLYESKKVMHWCASCQTSLAKHELEYKDVKDISIFVKFPIKDKQNEYLVIWTTTPWTLAFNLAIMVHPDFDYVKIKVGNEYWILAKQLAPLVVSGLLNKNYEVVEEFKGKELEGMEYEHFWKDEIHYFEELKKKHKNVHTVVLSDIYVTLSAGSGLVHCAPGCGPEDYEVGHKYGLPAFNNINEDGTFPEDMGKFSGLKARQDDEKFIQALGKYLITKTEVEHAYAHCWRCHNPVVFRTTIQWFFKVEDLIPELVRINKDILWVPKWAGTEQFDSWLRNLRDNSITRQRFWGTPLPIWRCNKCKQTIVIGSREELKSYAGNIPEELHVPWIDEVKWSCNKCNGTMERIPDVIDVWVDAGSASWAALDWPQKEEIFKELFPADFILEGKDQIRGWFNLLLVASMVAMNKPSFKAVYMHGFITDWEGRKMSKSLGNVVTPYEIIDKYGADLLRYYFISGANAGVDINFNWNDVKVKYKNLTILWNLYNLLKDICNELDYNPFDEDEVIMKNMYEIEERYIMSKINSTLRKVTRLFDAYKLDEVPEYIEEFFLELSRTYIQIVRERLAYGNEEDKKVIGFVLAKCLLTTLKMFAPIAPFITEYIYQDMRKSFVLKEESIHLFSWPKYNEAEINAELEYEFEIVKNVIEAILAAREKAGYGVRWPLKEVIVVSKDKETIKAVERLKDIIARQVNVKDVSIMERFELAEETIKPNYEKIKPDFGDATPKIIAHVAIESPESIMKHINEEGKFTIEIDGVNYEIRREHLMVTEKIPASYVAFEFKKGKVYLNREIDDALEAEGYARELIRRIQAARKKAGLVKKDRISLFVKAEEDLKEMLKKFEEMIKERVGASHFEISMLEPTKKHEHHFKDKIKIYDVEFWFDKV